MKNLIIFALVNLIFHVFAYGLEDNGKRCYEIGDDAKVVLPEEWELGIYRYSEENGKWDVNINFKEGGRRIFVSEGKIYYRMKGKDSYIDLGKIIPGSVYEFTTDGRVLREGTHIEPVAGGDATR